VAASSIDFVKSRGGRIDFREAFRLNALYNEAIVTFLARHPEVPQLLVAFEDVLRDPARQAARLAQFVGVAMTTAQERVIERFVIPPHRRSAARRIGFVRSLPWRLEAFTRKALDDPRRIGSYLHQGGAVVRSMLRRGRPTI
jgi:hypothetical protein